MPALRLRPGPAAVAVVSMVCLLLGLLYLALQIRTVFSDQLKQEYASLVLDAAARAASSREQLRVWQQVDGADAQKQHNGEHSSPGRSQERNGQRNSQRTQDRNDGRNEQRNDGRNDQRNDERNYEDSRAELTRRLASLAALVNASPEPTPYIAPALLAPGANLAEIDLMFANVSTYWHTQRDALNADMRVRIKHVARTLIALAALLFSLLITALGMYARRNRQLAGQSDQFEHASLHDSMTGLPNRRKLLAALEQATRRADAEPAAHGSAEHALGPAAAAPPIAVLYVDLDGFKQVNDSRGHHVGDELLIAVAARFRESVRKADLVARIGGDEFAVLVNGYSTNAELAEIARRLIACVVHADERMGLGLVRASIGIASYPDPIDDYRRLLAAADDAMYQVKRGGKNGYAFVSSAIRPAAS